LQLLKAQIVEILRDFITPPACVCAALQELFKFHYLNTSNIILFMTDNLQGWHI